MKKKLVSTILTFALAFSLVGCGAAGTGAAGDKADASGTSITIFNSKMEVQEQFENMAEEYSKTHGVKVEVYYSSDTVASHISTKYAANDPYTIAMVDAKDIYTLADEYAADLKGEDWTTKTDYAITVNDRLVGFPTCIEARGVMYNASAIEAITGEDFDPASVATLDAFEALCEKLVAGGMANPTGIMKEDWSLAAHYLAEVYELQDDPDAFANGLVDGSKNFADDASFNALMDTFDVLKKYNTAKDSPVAAEREVLEQKLAEGEIAFMFGGNWDWSMINAYDYSEKMGMMPLPSSTKGNTYLVGGGSKYFYIDSSDKTSDTQRQAAKDFLNWLSSDPEGNKFLTEECALVPAISGIDCSALDPLSQSVKKYADEGKLIPCYNYLPDDHIPQAGGVMQKYLADVVDRAGLASELETYWSSAKIVAH